jgi:hypothetical protein
MGCGKTWLFTTIDDKLRLEAKPKDRIATCHFSNAPASTDARAVICSLLSQLGLREKIHSALRALCDELEHTPLVATPTTQQLREALLKVLEPGGNDGTTFILVDAIDEIPFCTCPSQRAKIVTLLNTLAKSRISSLRMLMTSRPHGDLLNSFAGSGPAWKAYPIPDNKIQVDIERYVRAAVEQLAMDCGVNENSQERLIARLAGPKQTM